MADKDFNYPFMIKTQERTHELYCSTDDERRLWMLCLKFVVCFTGVSQLSGESENSVLVDGGEMEDRQVSVSDVLPAVEKMPEEESKIDDNGNEKFESTLYIQKTLGLETKKEDLRIPNRSKTIKTT